MSNFQFALQKYAPKDHSGLITTNNLYEMFMKEPQLATKTIRNIYKLTMGYAYEDFCNRFPVEYVEQEDGFYEWMLKGQDERNLPLIDAWGNAGGTIAASLGNLPAVLGKGGASFWLAFDEDMFDEGDVLRGEREEYHALIQTKSTRGSLYIYKVQLVGTADHSIPSTELFVGSRWSKDYNLQQNVLSYRGTKPNFGSPFAMRNRPSMLRMEYLVPGSMIDQGKNEPLKFNFVLPNGKQVPVWTNYYDMLANYQFDQQYYRMELYGRKNWDENNQYLNRDENTNFKIASGSGFFEQIAPSNRHYYTNYDLDWHIDLLVDMGVGKLERGKRKIKVMTGEFGAIEIHKQIESKARGWTTLVQAPLVSRGAANNLGTSNPLSFGGQWSEYRAVNGVELSVEILPFFDDDVRFKTYHPDNKGLTESHRMLALDYGGDAGIKRIQVKGRDEVYGVLPGTRDPYTPGGKGKPKMIASKIDGYEVVKQRWGGFKIEDPTKVVDLQYNFSR